MVFIRYLYCNISSIFSVCVSINIMETVLVLPHTKLENANHIKHTKYSYDFDSHGVKNNEHLCDLRDRVIDKSIRNINITSGERIKVRYNITLFKSNDDDNNDTYKNTIEAITKEITKSIGEMNTDNKEEFNNKKTKLIQKVLSMLTDEVYASTPNEDGLYTVSLFPINTSFETDITDAFGTSGRKAADAMTIYSIIHELIGEYNRNTVTFKCYTKGELCIKVFNTQTGDSDGKKDVITHLDRFVDVCTNPQRYTTNDSVSDDRDTQSDNNEISDNDDNNDNGDNGDNDDNDDEYVEVNNNENNTDTQQDNNDDDDEDAENGFSSNNDD